jgi:hypothetical protein
MQTKMNFDFHLFSANGSCPARPGMKWVLTKTVLENYISGTRQWNAINIDFNQFDGQFAYRRHSEFEGSALPSPFPGRPGRP